MESVCVSNIAIKAGVAAHSAASLPRSALRSLPEHFPQPHQQLAEFRLVPLLRVQIGFVVVDGVDQPPDLVLVQIDLHAFYCVLHVVSSANFHIAAGVSKR